MEYGSWSQLTSEVTVVPKLPVEYNSFLTHDGNIVIAFTKTHLHYTEWDLLEASYDLNDTIRQLSASQTSVIYTVLMQRRPFFYHVSVVAPSFIIVALSLIGFFSPQNPAEEREEKLCFKLKVFCKQSCLGHSWIDNTTYNGNNVINCVGYGISFHK